MRLACKILPRTILLWLSCIDNILQSRRNQRICMGNHMISSLIWDKSVSIRF